MKAPNIKTEVLVTQIDHRLLYARIEITHELLHVQVLQILIKMQINEIAKVASTYVQKDKARHIGKYIQIYRPNLEGSNGL